MATSTLQPSEQCDECGGRVQADNTERVCQDCGLVVSTDAIDRGPDWGRDDGETDPERAMPGKRTLSDRGMGTEIGHPNERDKRDDRLAEWHRRAKQDKKDRNRAYATGEIRRIASTMDWGDGLQEQACQLFTTIHDAHDLNGWDLDTIAAVCVWLTGRLNAKGLSPTEVTDVARDVPRRRLLRRSTDLSEQAGIPVPPPSVQRRIETAAAGHDHLGQQTVRRAQRLADRADQSVLHSGSPSTAAAALLYLARPDGVTQASIAAAADVTRTALRDRRDALTPSLRGQTALSDY